MNNNLSKKALILYHSGAGSTKFTSQMIEKELSESLHVKTESINFNYNYSKLYDYDVLIFGFPTYHCEPSTSIMEFLEKTEMLNLKIKTFFFTSYGLYTGDCSRIFYEKLKEKNFEILDFAEFKSPASDGVLMLPSSIRFMFNFGKDYLKNIKHFCEKIKNFQTLKERKKPKKKWYVPLNDVAKIYGQRYYDKMRDNMHIKKRDCTNCNLCVKVCDRGCFTKNVQTPNLNTSNCEFCLACIHYCPEKAIIFSDKMTTKPRLDRKFFKNKNLFYQNSVKQ